MIRITGAGTADNNEIIAIIAAVSGRARDHTGSVYKTRGTAKQV